MLIRRPVDIPSSEITPESAYQNRREFMKTASAFLIPTAVGAQSRSGRYDTTERVTPYEYASSYNNYYEFGTDKADPSRNSGNFKTKPWTVSVEGLAKKPARYDLDDLIRGLPIEDRIYRMRCVERWSMVIPWRGFPLADLIKRLEPLPSGEYVEFKTVLRERPDARPAYQLFGGGLTWPYTKVSVWTRQRIHCADRHRHLRQTAAEPEWRALAAGYAVEIWLQRNQSHRLDSVCREATR